MVGGPWLQASSCKSLISPFHNSQNFVPHLPTKPSKKLCQVTASSGPSGGAGRNPSSSPRGRNPLALVLEVPGTIWKQTLRPLSDFAFGRKSIWEGGIGLFTVSGAALLALTLVWLRGFHVRSRFRKYHAVFEFSQACGICVGTPVRIRGVTVGSVVGVNSSLKSIDATVEFEDDKIIVPRNSLVEVNQSGLLMETLIDITPRDPLPTPSAGPLDPDCAKEDLIVCDRERIRGEQGVSLDELVGIFTHLGREMEEIGVSKSYRLAEKVASVVEEAQPLLAKIEALAENIQPLLIEVRDNALLKDVESLTKTLADATEDLRLLKCQQERSTRIRLSCGISKSVQVLCKRCHGHIAIDPGDFAKQSGIFLGTDSYYLNYQIC
ncbi:protein TRIGALACTOSYLDIACYLGLYCEROL 2, chloroplastic-like isoform X2 [Phoenix dactylifera]|uniref:Protein TRIGALACTOSYLDIACYLGLYCEROL 2, chloroplastic-like isoform X2 n=1 Tax=Phoenix dactylifera TaxID=42345 RepID=A0A8B9ATY7_PHODC|nr:protein TRIGALACTOSYLDIACYLGLYCEROL 2, chloroplastic-like isoform X2 [Phoenix dactylifera]